MSGGGYRAVAACSGAMEALAASRLFEAVMYVAGLSGSSWYLSSSYVHESLENLQTKILHHDWLRTQMETSLTSFLFDISFYVRYRAYAALKSSYNQQTTFVDLYGLAIGETFLGADNVRKTNLSSLREYVNTYEVPLPILTCAHVRDHLSMSDFWDEVEMTPYEVAFPSYGINIPTEKFNSIWRNGVLQQELMEPHLHYVMGASGSAFAIAWKNLGQKSEISEEVLEHIEILDATEVDGLVEQGMTELKDEEEIETSALARERIIYKREMNYATDEENWLDKLEKELNHQPEEEIPEDGISGRGFILKRTAKVRNCALGHESLTRYCMKAQPLDKKKAPRHHSLSMDTEDHNISLCDPGIGCNLPFLLRSQRTVDVLIAIDCSMYDDEEKLRLSAFATVEKQARDYGVKFPRVDLERIAEDPFQEMYIFEDEEDPDCPLVLWFTLANAKFKRLTDPPRRPGFPEDSGSEPFNDFTLFPTSNEFGTFNLSFSALTFDRLRELMKFNILENIEVVKNRIASRVRKMRKHNA